MTADKTLSLDHQLCFALYAASNAMTRLYRDRLEPLGLTYPQYLVMLILWEQDGLAIKTLGERLHLDSGTLTPMLKRMEQAGLVARSRDPADERQVTIRLTPQGRALEAQVAAIQRDLSCLLPLEPKDIARLRAELRGLAAGLIARDSD
ncbi:MarR family transcriptional regulator [uncultured Ferrovibrio sp.]|jgi:DNA-binding MarR family transcriptional regulator|uniref:MarR family winged helix-turn-helix transcriptional regulator n=1 Tax=uncultured Ferrovibrio sp. TaxID=1576913 RepID=UPI00261A1D01|nr:MarR family transcriptional regulator [uncultured Ferrovibrio sp.]